jgi:hypothetical protein
MSTIIQRSTAILKGLVLSTLVTMQLSACETLSDPDNGVSVKGTLPLSAVKLGMNEATIKEALITFQRDPSAAANAGGKSQYLSRETTPAGGQYVVQCKEGAVYQVAIIYKTPINKEAAQSLFKSLLPTDAPPQSRVDDQNLKAQPPREDYYFGDDYLIELGMAPGSILVNQIKADHMELLKKAQADATAEKVLREAQIGDSAQPEEKTDSDQAMADNKTGTDEKKTPAKQKKGSTRRKKRTTP